jgi:hypothetical protein
MSRFPEHSKDYLVSLRQKYEEDVDNVDADSLGTLEYRVKNLRRCWKGKGFSQRTLIGVLENVEKDEKSAAGDVEGCTAKATGSSATAPCSTTKAGSSKDLPSKAAAYSTSAKAGSSKEKAVVPPKPMPIAVVVPPKAMPIAVLPPKAMPIAVVPPKAIMPMPKLSGSLAKAIPNHGSRMAAEEPKVAKKARPTMKGSILADILTRKTGASLDAEEKAKAKAKAKAKTKAGARTGADAGLEQEAEAKRTRKVFDLAEQKNNCCYCTGTILWGSILRRRFITMRDLVEAYRARGEQK